MPQVVEISRRNLGGSAILDCTCLSKDHFLVDELVELGLVELAHGQIQEIGLQLDTQLCNGWG